MTEREQFEKAFPVPDGAVWWDVIEAYCRKNKTTVHQYNDKWQAWQAARATMTEREQFEKAFPVPVSMVWNGFTYAIVDAHEISSCWDYQLRWETWQAARATPALPDGMAIVPVDKLPAAVAVELSRLRDFRSAVIGWRESDHPEGFCRKTAEFVTILGQIAAKDELK